MPRPLPSTSPNLPRRTAIAALLALALGAVAAGRGSAQEIAGQREYNVKAVSLYAFGRYVTWPDSAFEAPTSPFVIGVLGGNPFGDALHRVASKKTMNGRPIVVRELVAAEEAAACHIVFVTRQVAHEVETKLFQQSSGKPVLLVGETPGFTDRGGIINFYHSGTTVRFELNPDRGLASKLSLNAKLLSLGVKGQTNQ
ncbi:MAG TPA: YfiR family protein [Lacipirellulaceae bacterium]|nr:YfiR family protein [Lacipirellulaceae bacterium]